MAGSYIEVKTDDAEFGRELMDITRRLEDLPAIHKILGAVALASVQRNFEEGGRPKWAPHSPVTIARRGSGARILVDRGFAGGLLGGMSAQADEENARVGTNDIRGAVHQFGAKKGSFGTILERVRGHNWTRQGKTVWVRDYVKEVSLPWGNIPARPFLMIQDEDKTEMLAEVKEYLAGGQK